MTYFPGSSGPLDQAYDTALLDLDGVVYIGPDPVPFAIESINAAVERGIRVGYVTNNASRPADVVAAHLRELGLTADVADVVTSAQAGARALVDYVSPGSIVLALGGPGVGEALEQEGFTVVDATRWREAEAVLQGFGQNIGWSDLAAAGYAISDGAVWVATNRDTTFPTADGLAPGNGSFVELLMGVTGDAPVVTTGKPERTLIDVSIERLAASSPLMIGDRLDTDIWAGNNAGIATLLVLTGVTSVADLIDAPVELRPTYLAEDLRGLHDAHVEAIKLEGRWVCGDSWCGADDFQLGGRPGVNQVKAALSAAWAATEIVPAARAAVIRAADGLA